MCGYGLKKLYYLSLCRSALWLFLWYPTDVLFCRDRSPEAGPLESRKGLLGNILRLMTCAGHTQTRNAAGELMWAVCNGDGMF